MKWEGRRQSSNMEDRRVMGTTGEVRKLQQKVSDVEGNKLSVCLKLQADFYAGLWTHYNQKYLEEGDIDEALSAAQTVGDEAIQKLRASLNRN
jgi:predicted metalloprotease